MKRRKICFLFNMAPKYNEEFYLTLDKSFNCDFIIGESREDIKEMDISLLSNYYQPKHQKLYGSFSCEKGAFLRLIKGNYTDIITTLEPYNLTLWLVKLYCLVTRTKLYYITHGWYGKESFFKRFFKKIDYCTTTSFLLYGNYAKRIMLAQGFSQDKLFVIHNSLNYSKQIELRKRVKKSDIFRAYFGNSNPVLLFIGRLTPIKQLDMVLRSLHELRNIGYMYNLIFVGDGAERKKLEKLTIELDLSSRVWFYGPCYEEGTIAEFISNSDLCVSPGNVGLTAIHSLVFGCPVLTHSNFSSQMPEFESIKEDVTGTFFNQGDVESLTNSIIRWFQNHSDRRDEVKNACYEEIDNYWTPEFELNVLKKALHID